MIHRFRLTLVWAIASMLIIAVLLAAGMFVFTRLSLSQQEGLLAVLLPYRFHLLIPLVLLVVALIWGAKWFLESYWFPLEKMLEEMELTQMLNPAFRLSLQGSRQLRELAASFNRQADRVSQLKEAVDREVDAVRSALEEEKLVLEALVEELYVGVIVTNLEGAMLLYNKTAKTFFHSNSAFLPGGSKLGPQGYLGLGRPVTRVMETPLLEFTMRDLRDRHSKGHPNLVQHFMLWHGPLLLRVQTLGILDRKGNLKGFIFLIRDTTPSPESGSALSWLEDSRQQKRRSGIANIRASIETVLDYPGMPKQKQKELLEGILENSVELTRMLEPDAPKEFDQVCHLEEVPLVEWLTRFCETPERGIPLEIDSGIRSSSPVARLNRFLITNLLSHLLHMLKSRLGIENPWCRLSRKQHFVLIDLVWRETPLDVETMRKWLDVRLDLEMEAETLTGTKILQRHDAEVWYEGDAEKNEMSLRLLFPEIEKTVDVEDGPRHISLGNRPIFYDFNLFDKSLWHPELDDIPLRDLRFTVFDTETTGLEPSGGDEIISIGAVRIVNRQLLLNETFEQLIDPQRELSRESIAIHGIQPEMLQGCPKIDEILPRFSQYVEDTVLVAHNAAFDMRFLQIKEESSGVRFTNPVLDTLLLSAVLHPNQDHHSLDAIAKRLDLQVKGRHTALGDAIVTGEIFLGLLKLLEEKDIRTLKDAQNACKKTPYSRQRF